MDLTAISAQLEKYENKWIAIDESAEKIVGVGDDAFEATDNAERSGYQETILKRRFCSKYHPSILPLSHWHEISLHRDSESSRSYETVSKTVPYRPFVQWRETQGCNLAG